MQHEDMQQLAGKALDLAKKSGSQQTMARVVRARIVGYEVRNGEVEEVTDSTSLQLSLALYVDGRYSTHTTSDLRETSLMKFIQEATLLTRAVSADPCRRILPSAYFANIPKVQLDIFDPSVQGRTRDQRLDLCYTMNQILTRQAGYTSASSGVSDEHKTEVMMGTNGFQGVSEKTKAGIESYLTIEGKNGKKINGGFSKESVRENSKQDPIDVAQEALQRTLATRDVHKGPTKKTQMVVERLAGARMVSQLLSAAMGPTVQQQRSFLVGRLGKKVISEKLTIIDDPLLPRGLASRLWDLEGLAARAFPVVEGGVLRNFYLNDYYAQKLKMEPTAGSLSNVVIKPGKRSEQQIVADVKDGIFVTGWSGGNMDSTTGDFSLGASGFIIQNGKITDAINEMNVTGNLLELFTRVVEVGNDPWEFGGGMRTPTLAFDGVQFSGA